MSTLKTTRLLHVEDDPMQQRVLMHHLKSMEDFHFETTAVPSEDEAMAAFRVGKFDLVVVDYQLAQGNGLHLLKRIRELDPVIPIIGISGVATSEVAAELVRAGADDYFDKRELTSAKLTRSVRAALLRAATVRNRIPQPVGISQTQITVQLLELSLDFSEKFGPELVLKLNAIEEIARQAGLRVADLEQLYLSANSQLSPEDISKHPPLRQALRVLALDLIIRLSGDLTEDEFTELVHSS